MTNIKAILKGWSNYLHANPQQEATARERAKICARCPHAKRGSLEVFLPDLTLKKIQGYKCERCACPLSTLLRQNEKTCEKWKI